MNFKTLFRNQLGMSMTEGAIAIGLVGMGALAAASLSGNMAKFTSRSEGIVARGQFASALGSYLYTAAGCTELKGRPSYSTTAEPLALTQWNYMGLNRFEGGYNADGSKKTKTKYFTIEALDAYYEPVAGAPLVRAQLGGSMVDLSKTVLKIRAGLKVGNKIYDYFYNVPVLVDATGAVGFCSDEKTVAETCASIQGAYDPTEADPAKRCKIAEGCRIKGSFARYRCSSANIVACDRTRFGDVSTEVNKYTNGLSCPPNSVETLTHSTSWTSRSKISKKNTDTVTNEMWWYSCLECPAP